MKKNKNFKFLLSCILSVVLVAAIVLSLAGCKNNKPENSETSAPVTQTADITPTEIGNGEHYFTFTVKDADGKETVFDIKTDEKTVGAALLNEKLIDGEDGEYGLYVKSVLGITADYDKDKAFWGFYVNGNMAPASADLTDIKDGETYSFIYSK